MRAFLRAVLRIPKPPFVNPRAALVIGAIAASPSLAQTAPVKTFDLEQVTLIPLLEQVMKILKEYPELTRLRISGHTDNCGGHDYNVQLSQDRVEPVRRFLIERGVEPSRLEAKGYGPGQLIDTNATAAGRQKNRRTEFISISE